MKAEMKKSEDCVYCICLECKEKFNTDIDNCKFTDCQWCLEEEGAYIDRCGIFINLGGSYG